MSSQQTDDPVKSQLLRKASQQREDLGDEWKELSERTEKILTNALIIGGVLALTYIFVRQFSGKKSKKSKVKKAAAKPEAGNEPDEEPPASSVLSHIGTALLSQATVFLLNMAKEKLSEYIQAKAQKNDHAHP
jgi:hypothetical protein